MAKTDSELQKLGEALDSAAFRRSFSQDPLAAMEGSKIDSTAIPRDALDALAELSTTELRVLSNVKHSLKRAGVSDPTIANMV